MFLMHIWLISCGVVVCVFFEHDVSMILCVLLVCRAWLDVCSITLYAPSSLYVARPRCIWGLVFTCRVVKCRVRAYDVVTLVVGSE
jgi:hypothetical protein